jgi:hypothetical protein
MRTTLAVALTAVSLPYSLLSAQAQTLTYVLKPGSSIASICRNCDIPPGPPQPLTGSFDVTPMPVNGAFGVAAISNLQLAAPSFAIGGNGFIQRHPDSRMALVIDAQLKDERVLLSSGKSHFREGRAIQAVLASRGSQGARYVLVLSASPVGGVDSDADHDSVADTIDNCPTMPNSDQRDDDEDSVGNPCDGCSDGSRGLPVTPDGCRFDQLCPCHVTTSGVPWENPAAYLRCVARSLRILRRTDQMSRGDAIKALRQAGRSGCGRPIVASLCRVPASKSG